MSLKILPSMASVDAARQAMVAMGASAIESPTRQRLRRFGLNRSIALGDHLKSWDMLETIRFLQAHVAPDQPILDIGAYASEITVSLDRVGYTRLSGVDLNRRIRRMPHADRIDYRVSDFMDTPFDDESFRAITAISVIEHGLDRTALLGEVARLLQPGGWFVASFDYWGDKIDTAGITIFDMSWTIFSQAEVEAFLAEAATFGLHPAGALDFTATERPVHYMERDYSFGWLALQKAA
jgi:SAM-dependent methyltransferase